MNLSLVSKITKEQLRNDMPSFKPGDTLKVYVRIREGEKSRIQIFEGVVLKKQNGGVAETFTVRKISYGVGVEKTLPVHSPKIEKIEIVREGRVRRAKLNYLRDRLGKSAKVKDKKKFK